MKYLSEKVLRDSDYTFWHIMLVYVFSSLSTGSVVFEGGS